MAMKKILFGVLVLMVKERIKRVTVPYFPRFPKREEKYSGDCENFEEGGVIDVARILK
ncbi:MAG: hypothetical protein AAB267_03995 [Candidatus Desantisbacteria bacterium]